MAGVIVALLAIALLCFGLWYAKKKGYLPSKFSSLLPCILFYLFKKNYKSFINCTFSCLLPPQKCLKGKRYSLAVAYFCCT